MEFKMSEIGPLATISRRSKSASRVSPGRNCLFSQIRKLVSVAALALIVNSTAVHGEFAVKPEKLHPIDFAQMTKGDSDQVVWFKENWGMDDESGWIKFYKNMEVIFADPIVDDSGEGMENINTICEPNDQEIDLKWKYCGFYTPLFE